MLASSALALLEQIIAEVSHPEVAPKPPVAAAKPATQTAAKPAVAKAKAESAPQAKNKAAREEAAAAAGATPAPPPPAPAVEKEAMAATGAIYQSDTYRFACEATVLAVEPPASTDKGLWAVILDATCFHPQGGGQPADVGTISSFDTASSPFAVSMVRKDASGVVRHEGATQPTFTAGSRVQCLVDDKVRVYNARIHSAGHLIDVAMTDNGMATRLRPTKGYHFTPGAYVEYDGKLEAAEREALVPKLQESMDRLISEGVATVVQSVEAQQLDTVCPPSALPADRNLWGTGWVRVVSVGGLGCPCGGTHVRDTSELGKVKVEAVKTKGKVTRVSYTVE